LSGARCGLGQSLVMHLLDDIVVRFVPSPARLQQVARLWPTVGLALAAPFAPQPPCDEQERRIGGDALRLTPVESGHDQIVIARVAPQPEPLAQRLDRPRGDKAPTEENGNGPGHIQTCKVRAASALAQR
jgi:hypothetical protein